MAGTRLASLRASAELDAKKYDTGARQVESADKRMQASQKGVATSMTQTQARASESARSFDKFRQSLDATYRAQRQVESGSARLNAMLARGDITATQHAASMTLLQRKYADAGNDATRLQASVGGLYGAFGNLRLILATVGVGFLVREYVQLADASTNLSARIRLVAGSAEAAARVQENLLEVANRTRVGFESVVTLYARLGRSADALGISQERLIAFTETFSQALKISGATTAEASSTVIQLSQALASGFLRGAELNSILEQGGRAATALADGLGVPIGALKKMGEEGELTAKRVIEALESQGVVIKREFDQMPATVGDALTVLNNQMLTFVGKIDKAAGASADLSASITEFGKTLNDPELIAAGVEGLKLLIDLFTGLGKAVAGARMAIADSYALVPDFAKEFLGDSETAYHTRTQSFEDIVLGPENERAAYLSGALRPVSNRFFYNQAIPGAAANDNAAIASAGGSPATVQETRKEVEKLSTAEKKLHDQRERERVRAEKAETTRQDNLDEYLKGLDDDLRLTKLTGVARKQEEAILRATALIQNDLVKGEEQLSAEVKKRIGDRVAEIDAEEKKLAAIDESKRKMEEFNDEVLGETADAIANIWENGKDGIDDTLQYWKRKIIAWLAEMAAKLLLQPIIAPIIGGAAGIGLGALGSSSGGLGANFGTQGVGGVSSLGQALGGLGRSIDSLAGSWGWQGNPGDPGNAGLFGTSTMASDAVGGGLAGAGIGATIAGLTGGNSLGGTIGGAIGGVAGSFLTPFLGPLGPLLGAAVGGFLGSLFKGGKPTNATATLAYDASGNTTLQPFSKMTAETQSAITSAADQIKGASDALTSAGATFNDSLKAIAIGVRDESYIQFSSGKTLRSAVGDPNALALKAVQELARTASYDTESVATVARRQYGSLEEMVKAVDFAKNVYDAIAEAKPAMGATEKAMRDLTEGLKVAKKEAERLGLSVARLDVGARKLFDLDIATQIKQIIDPVGAALDEFERGALARIDVAKKLGSDLVQVERLNALQRAQIVKQVEEQSFAGLKSLIDDLEFGGLSAGVAPSEQYFTALSRYNTAKSAALDLRTPEAIGEFESYSRSLVPIAQSFLGVSERFGELRSDILSTARTLGSPQVDASTTAIVQATVESSVRIVEEVRTSNDKLDRLWEEVRRGNGFMAALMQRYAAAA